jgi:hypothetical protein
MHVRRILVIMVAVAAAALVTGCFSMPSIGNIIANQAQPQQQAQPEPQEQPQPQPQAQPAPQGTSPGAAMAYQYQFNAFYGGFWNMGWFGYGDANYKPGQGTVWTFKGDKEKDSFVLERALLKVNADKTAWWRMRMDSGKAKDRMVYEFLVGADGVVTKVRYQDPDGNIGEFVPQNQQQAQPAEAPKSRADMAKYLVDKQSVTVKAGTFATDHYLYNDEKGRGTGEYWASDKVPGYMVKSVYTGKKDKKVSTGELTEIENGVKTTLNSY